jgi:hypothetical protein
VRNDGADWQQHYQMEEAWVRHELARAAELAARTGGHPEAAEGLERVLLTVAELPPIPQRDDAQPDLFGIAA